MSHSCTGSGTARWPFSLTLINDRKDIVWHRHGVAINKRNSSSSSSIKSKLHVLQWKAMDQSRPDPAPDRVLLHFWSAGSLLQRRTLFAFALFAYFCPFFSLFSLLLLYRNFICWRIFHRLARWQQLARRSSRNSTRVWELNL